MSNNAFPSNFTGFPVLVGHDPLLLPCLDQPDPPTGLQKGIYDEFRKSHSRARTRSRPPIRQGDYYMLAETFGDSVSDRRESFAANYPNLVTDNEDARDHEESMIEGDMELLDDDFSMGNK
ncbi:hypothetical protein AAC387_Pa12g0322 [Persea americana]